MGNPATSGSATTVRRALAGLHGLSALGRLGRDERRRRAAFLLLALFTCIAGTLVGVLYLALDLRQVALAPFTYVAFLLLSLAGLVASGRFGLFARIQLGLLLLLPFVVEWQLGGFAPAGGVMLWSILAPIGAFVFLGEREGGAWFGAYAALTAASLAYDMLLRPPWLSAGGLVGSGALAMGLALLNVLGASSVIFTLIAYTLLALRREEAKVEGLLLNVLPAAVAERMRAGETAIADSFEEVAILFADVVGFTRLAATRPAGEVVRLLDRIFTAFDEVVELWRVEKIKTVGDAYMAAAGLTPGGPDRTAVLAEVALAMRAAAARIEREEGLPLRLRIGLHEGPVVAGVIGRKRFAYDVWGDTVNLASRMETTAPPDTIQVSALVAAKLERHYLLQSREAVPIRGHGEMRTFLLLRRRPDAPGDAFPVPQAGLFGSGHEWSVRARFAAARPSARLGR